jgi:hypothetical protein
VAYPVTRCETVTVAFEVNLWLATSAAAPVIALAAVVALPDTLGVVVKAKRQRAIARFEILVEFMNPPAGSSEPTAPIELDSASSVTAVNKVVMAARIIRMTSVFNVILQAVLLAGSLAALAYNRNIGPPWVAILLAVGGVVILAITVSTVPSYQRALENARKRASDGRPVTHYGRPASWAAVSIVIVGFIVGGIAMVVGPTWWLFWTGAGIVVIGGIFALSERILDDWY